MTTEELPHFVMFLLNSNTLISGNDIHLQPDFGENLL